MKSNIGRQLLLKEVQKEFGTHYPYLKIDFSRNKARGAVPAAGQNTPVENDENQCDKAAALAARELLYREFELNGEMKIGELEMLLQYEFGLPVQILRKSGNLWLETRLTQHWTLRQQNDHGKDIANGFPLLNTSGC